MHQSSRASQLGALVLLLRPTYLAAEYAVAGATQGGYSFVHDTISKLGEIGASDLYSSPRHAVINNAFKGYGVALAGGSLLMAEQMGPAVTGLLVVSGVSSYATGLAPLDVDRLKHSKAATPLFVAQPVALALLGHRLRHERPHLARALLATGIVTAGCTVWFARSVEGDRHRGVVERVALWPILGGLGAFAWSHRPRRTRRPEVTA